MCTAKVSAIRILNAQTNAWSTVRRLVPGSEPYQGLKSRQTNNVRQRPKYPFCTSSIIRSSKNLIQYHAHMSVFTNDLTNFWICPAVGLGIPNFWNRDLSTFKVKSRFLNLDPKLDIFYLCQPKNHGKWGVWKHQWIRHFWLKYLFVTSCTPHDENKKISTKIIADKW